MLVPFCVRVCERRREGGWDGEREAERERASELERCAEGIYLGCACCRR